MAVRINRVDFLQSLGRVEPGLSTRDFIEQSSCYVFSDGWIASFNDEICCRSKSGLPADFVGAVHAKPLKCVLEAITADEITVDFSGKEFLIKAGSERAGIRMEREIVLPVDEVTVPEQWLTLPPDFASAIDKVVDAAGTNDEEFLSVCVHIHPDYVEATDRSQMCRYTLETGVDKSFLVRAKSVAHITKLDVTKIGQTDQWVHFRNRTLVFSCRRELMDYFDLSEIFDFSGTATKLPRGGERASELAGSFCEGKDNDKVIVKLTNGNMNVRGEGSFGWGEKNMPMEYEGDDLAFRLSPSMLVKLVKENTDCELDGCKLCVRGDKWIYITTLGKIKATSDAVTVPDDTGEEAGDDGGD